MFMLKAEFGCFWWLFLATGNFLKKLRTDNNIKEEMYGGWFGFTWSEMFVPSLQEEMIMVRSGWKCTNVQNNRPWISTSFLVHFILRNMSLHKNPGLVNKYLLSVCQCQGIELGASFATPTLFFVLWNRPPKLYFYIWLSYLASVKWQIGKSIFGKHNDLLVVPWELHSSNEWTLSVKSRH